jgi:hypothetical protein
MIKRWRTAFPLAAFAAVGVFAAACPPNPQTAPGPDAADAFIPPAPPASAPDATIIDCTSACAAMARVGCLVLSDCAQVVCAINADSKFKHYDLACLTHVLVRSDVVACGADCR